MFREWYEPPAITEAFARCRREQNLKEGRLSNLKGKRAEARALEALQRNLPRFAKCARAATDAEDGRGIDVVLETATMGALYLQIKSSRGCARQYRRKRRKATVAIVVIPEDMDDRTVCKKVLHAVHRLRKEFRALRRQTAH